MAGMLSITVCETDRTPAGAAVCLKSRTIAKTTK